MSTELDALRQQIDSLDDALHDLLVQRAGLVANIGRLKQHGATGSGWAVFAPTREIQILRRLKARHQCDLKFDTVWRVFRQIIASSTAQQGGLRMMAAPEVIPTLLQHWPVGIEWVQEGAEYQAVACAGWDGVLPDGFRVVAKLPLLASPLPECYVLSKHPPQPSGDDITLFLEKGEVVTRDGFLSPESFPHLRFLGGYARVIDEVEHRL